MGYRSHYIRLRGESDGSATTGSNVIHPTHEALETTILIEDAVVRRFGCNRENGFRPMNLKWARFGCCLETGGEGNKEWIKDDEALQVQVLQLMIRRDRGLSGWHDWGIKLKAGPPGEER